MEITFLLIAFSGSESQYPFSPIRDKIVINKKSDYYLQRKIYPVAYKKLL